MRTQRMLRYTPVLALLGLGLFTLPAQAAPTFCPATGHYYEVISGSRTWFQAEADAKSPGRIWEGLTGHLATITSAGESSCIDALVSSSAWVGGYQPSGTQEPNSGWSWVTGESWGYTNWNGGEPNDAGGEDCLEIGGNAGWNDLNCNATRSAYVIEYDFEDEGQAAFIVNKIFTDDNPAEVEVTLSCNTGLPLEQSQEISEGEHVEFVVTAFDAGDLDCEVTEQVPEGYSASYNDGYGSVSDESCSWEEISYQEFRCTITNTPEPVTVTVDKEWVYNDTDSSEISDEFEVELECDAEIEGGYDIGGGDWRAHWNSSGDDSHDFTVYVEYGGATCNASESVYDDAVESDDSDCDYLEIDIAEGAECTIVNTVFFEGIPTLNQYGLAILALLMLGVGFVGFRRFA